MSKSELARTIDVRQASGKSVHVVASEAERAALTQRFGLVRIDRLEADVLLDRVGEAATATGRLTAEIVQSCAISGEDLAVAIDEPLAFRFVPAASAHKPDEEVELHAEDCDEIEFTGTEFDLGEAVAQSLALAIDPFLEGPNADEFRRKSGFFGDGPANPFAALAALKKKPD